MGKGQKGDGGESWESKDGTVGERLGGRPDSAELGKALLAPQRASTCPQMGPSRGYAQLKAQTLGSKEGGEGVSQGRSAQRTYL